MRFTVTCFHLLLFRLTFIVTNFIRIFSSLGTTPAMSDLSHEKDLKKIRENADSKEFFGEYLFQKIYSL
jgi:hypothetical protein